MRAVASGLVVAGLLAATTALSQGPLDRPAAASAPAADAANRYGQQRIDWKACLAPGTTAAGLPPGSEAMECGSYRVPRDWAAPGDGPDLTIAVTRIRPQVGEPAGTLFTNPGGPGSAGRALPLLFVAKGRRELLATYEVVGIDVRGTGQSTNVTCAQLADVGRELDARDRRPQNLDLIMDAASFIARACQNAPGGLHPFITTAQTVRDLDLLRSLLGRDRVSWLGYSGGGWLGAHYATAFPQRVGRFVFDAVPEFTSTWQPIFARQALGFQRRFDIDFLPYIAANDSYFHLGTTPGEVNGVYETVRARLAAEPLAYGDGGAVYSGELDLVIAFAMYSKASFQTVGNDLRTMRDMTDDRATARSSTMDAGLQARLERARRHARLGATMPLAPDAPKSTFLSTVCNDTPWAGDRAGLVAESQRLGQQYPLIGWHELSVPCLSWNRPSTTLPTPTGAGLPSVLFVQSERDPATPIEGARAAARNFAGAHLLTVVDEGDHGSYAISDNACVDRSVERFLLHGALPPNGSTCPGRPLGPPRPTPDPAAILDGLPVGTAAEHAAYLSRLIGPLPH